MDIFISYRRGEATFAAVGLKGSLERSGNNVFFDQHDIPSGVDFEAHIIDQIVDSDVLVALISTDWMYGASGANTDNRLVDPNDFVRKEIELAQESGVPVLPVLVENASIPDESGLPNSLKPILRLNFSHLRARFMALDLEQIEHAIGEVGQEDYRATGSFFGVLQHLTVAELKDLNSRLDGETPSQNNKKGYLRSVYYSDTATTILNHLNRGQLIKLLNQCGYSGIASANKSDLVAWTLDEMISMK